MINKVILTGRLTQDIELRRTNDGTPYAFFTIAVNRRQQDQTDFIPCTAWRQTAELMAQYLTKGALIGVEGTLQVFSQQKDGNYETRTTVQVSQLTFLETKAQADARNASFKNGEQSTSFNNQQPMTFAGTANFDQQQTTPAPSSDIENSIPKEFGQAEKVNTNDINLEEIKF